MLWELQPGEVEVKYDGELSIGDPCPNCGGQDCEYRETAHPTRQGYLQIGIACFNCGQKTVATIRDHDQNPDFSPVPLPKK